MRSAVEINEIAEELKVIFPVLVIEINCQWKLFFICIKGITIFFIKKALSQNFVKVLECSYYRVNAVSEVSVLRFEKKHKYIMKNNSKHF